MKYFIGILFIALTTLSYNFCQKSSFLDDAKSKIEEKGGGTKKKKKKSVAPTEKTNLEKFLHENKLNAFADFIKNSRFLRKLNEHQGTIIIPSNKQLLELKNKPQNKKDSLLLSVMSCETITTDIPNEEYCLFPSCLEIETRDAKSTRPSSRLLDIVLQKKDDIITHNYHTPIKPLPLKFEGISFFQAQELSFLKPLDNLTVLNSHPNINEYRRLIEIAIKENLTKIYANGKGLQLKDIKKQKFITFFIPENDLIHEEFKGLWNCPDECAKDCLIPFICIRCAFGDISNYKTSKEPISFIHSFNAEGKKIIIQNFDIPGLFIEPPIEIRMSDNCTCPICIYGTISFVVRTTIEGCSFVIYN